MVLVYAVFALALVFGIAAIVVGREARRLDAVAPQPTFNIDEATEWVGNRLPFEVSAVLSYDDVFRILGWNLDYLRSKGLSSSGPAGAGTWQASEVVVVPAELAAHVLDRAREVGATYSQDQVDAVIQAQLAYFDAIGAIGPEATPEPPDGPTA